MASLDQPVVDPTGIPSDHDVEIIPNPVPPPSIAAAAMSNNFGDRIPKQSDKVSPARDSLMEAKHDTSLLGAPGDIDFGKAYSVPPPDMPQVVFFNIEASQVGRDGGPIGEPDPDDPAGRIPVVNPPDPPVSQILSTDAGDHAIPEPTPPEDIPPGSTEPLIPPSILTNGMSPVLQVVAHDEGGPTGEPGPTFPNTIPPDGVPPISQAVMLDDGGPTGEPDPNDPNKTPQDGHPPRPTDKSFHAPAFPPEFKLNSALLVQLNTQSREHNSILVTKPQTNLPKAAGFSSFTSDDAKIFYLETYDLSYRLQLVKAIVEDMRLRADALPGEASKVESLYATLNSAISVTEELYNTTGLTLYPAPGTLV